MHHSAGAVIRAAEEAPMDNTVDVMIPVDTEAAKALETIEKLRDRNL